MRRRVALLVALAGCLAAADGSQAGRKGRCRLEVDNRTPFRVLVHVDGAYWGWVKENGRFTFTGIPQGGIVVYATTQYNEFSWGPKALKCEELASWDLQF